MPPHCLQRGRKLPRADEQVVDEAGFADGFDATLHVLAQQPARIGFVLHLVADADQQIADQRRDLVSDLGGGQVDPADDPRDEVGRRGGLQELARFVDARDGLDEDRLVDAVVHQLGAQVIGRKRPPDGSELVAHPRIGAAHRVP